MIETLYELQDKDIMPSSETPEEKIQSILGDLTSEEFQDIITQEINAEVIRVLYEDFNRNYLFPMIKEKEEFRDE